jgi:hypothetical protein
LSLTVKIPCFSFYKGALPAAKNQLYRRSSNKRPQSIENPVPGIAISAGNKVLMDLVNKTVQGTQNGYKDRKPKTDAPPLFPGKPQTDSGGKGEISQKVLKFVETQKTFGLGQYRTGGKEPNSRRHNKGREFQQKSNMSPDRDLPGGIHRLKNYPNISEKGLQDFRNL